jgi:hypothetical protein
MGYYLTKAWKNYFFLFIIYLPFYRKLLFILLFINKNLLAIDIYVSTYDAIWLKGSSIFLDVLC